MTEAVAAPAPVPSVAAEVFKANCIDCNADVTVHEDAVERWRIFNRILVARGEKPLGKREVVRCMSCYLSQRDEGERGRIDDFQAKRKLADSVRQTGRGLGIARLRAEIKGLESRQIVFAYANLIARGKTFPEVEMVELCAHEDGDMIRDALSTAGRMTARKSADDLT